MRPAIWVWTDAPVDFDARNSLKNSAVKPMFNMRMVCVCVCVILFLGFPGGSVGKESACHAGDLGSSPVLGRSSGEGKGYSLQYPGLKNAMDCIAQGIPKS